MNSFTFILISKETKKFFCGGGCCWLFLGILFFVASKVWTLIPIKRKKKRFLLQIHRSTLFSVTLQSSSHILKTKFSSLNKAFLLNDTFSSFLFFLLFWADFNERRTLFVQYWKIQIYSSPNRFWGSCN